MRGDARCSSNIETARTGKGLASNKAENQTFIPAKVNDIKMTVKSKNSLKNHNLTQLLNLTYIMHENYLIRNKLLFRSKLTAVLILNDAIHCSWYRR